MARTEYVEELLLKVKTDKSELEKIQKSFDELKITELLSPEAKKELEKAYKENAERLSKLKEIEKEIAAIKNLSGEAADEALAKLQEAYDTLKKEIDENTVNRGGGDAKSSVGSILKDGVKKGLVDFGKKAWGAIEDFAKDTFKQAVEMMREIAQYTDNSKLFSEEAANLKLTYGISGGEAYALQNALKDVGLSGIDEYLEKAWMLSDEQNEYLQEQLQMYRLSYEKDKEIALAFQEFEVELSQFKKEMQVELINFFMENKDNIKAVMKALMSFMEAGLQFFSWFMGLYTQDTTRSDYERTAATSDILQTYVTNNGGTNKSVTVSNTFNGVQSSDRTNLINAGNLTYEQIIKALE